ncbi:MAG: hypothetical protein ACRDNK_04260 [Solirubrobacteraceae bacterium]
MAGTNVNAVAVGAIGVGLIFTWSGLKGASILATLQSVIQGQKPSGANTHAITVPAAAAAAAAPGTSAPGDSSAHNGTAAQNQAVAKLLAAPYGWSTGSNWDSLVKLWNKESGWDALASNGNSGPDSGSAYGIPQSLPGSKMASAGADWRTNPATQIKWGLGYIKSRYGSPDAAWAHETANNWY